MWRLNSTIKNSLNARREDVKVYGLSAILSGYHEGSIRRKFQHKQGMWLRFKAVCGFHCKSDAGLEFLPATFNLRSATDKRELERSFRKSKTYIAKNERDAKQGIHLFKASSAQALFSEISREERRRSAKFNIVQDFIDNPALANYPVSSSKSGIKVNMRAYLVLTCSRTKREWTMLRAGSELHYALGRYNKNLNPQNKSSFLNAVDTSYWIDDLVNKGTIPVSSANDWPSSAISYLENLKNQGWTSSVDEEWRKIEGIFSKAASVYEGIICNDQDKIILKDAERMFHLIGADILIAGKQVGHQKVLQPYLIEWNSGPAFLDYGNSRNLEHLMIAEMAALYKGDVVRRPWWLPLFQQKEYQQITASTFSSRVYTNVWKKTTPW